MSHMRWKSYEYRTIFIARLASASETDGRTDRQTPGIEFGASVTSGGNNFNAFLDNWPNFVYLLVDPRFYPLPLNFLNLGYFFNWSIAVYSSIGWTPVTDTTDKGTNEWMDGLRDVSPPSPAAQWRATFQPIIARCRQGIHGIGYRLLTDQPATDLHVSRNSTQRLGENPEESRNSDNSDKCWVASEDCTSWISAHTQKGGRVFIYLNVCRAVPEFGCGCGWNPAVFSKSGQNPATGNILPEPDFWPDLVNCHIYFEQQVWL